MVNLGPYEQTALDILNDRYDNENLFAVLLYKESEGKIPAGINFIEKTKINNQIAYKIYFGMFQINIIVNFSRMRYEKTLLKPICLNKEYIAMAEDQELTNNKMYKIIKYYRKYKSITK